MNRPKKILSWRQKLSLVGLVFGLGLFLFIELATDSVPQRGRFENPIASQIEGKTCESWRDHQGIPHTRAQSRLVAFACMGLAHAQDRAWQMDFLRRVTRGRVSEVYGSSRIREDFILRTLGLPEQSQKLFQVMAQDLKEVFWAYSYGVNRGFQNSSLSYEFKVVGRGKKRIEPWHPEDSIALILLQAFNQTRRGAGRDLQEENWKAVHGGSVASLFDVNHLPWNVSILKEGEYDKKNLTPPRGLSNSDDPNALENSSVFYLRLPERPKKGASLSPSRESPKLPIRIQSPPSLETGKGSNNWVISPQKSQSGHAWLANDPHLQLLHPPFWHWSHVEGGGLDVIGAALPGVPVIVSGTNRNVSWGVTNSYMDVADAVWVDEKEVGNHSTTHRPLIWVKTWGGISLPFFFKSFQKTDKGFPIIPSESVVSAASGEKDKKLVFYWSGFDIRSDDFRGLLDVMTSRSVQDADRAFASIGVPSWNFVFADTHGQTGFRVVGRIPLREKQKELGTPEGRLADFDPVSYLSKEQMPHLLNPKRGFVVTANNSQWPSDSRFDPGRSHSPSFRAFRIEEMLKKQKKHDLLSLQKIQCDVQAVDARFLVKGLVEALPKRLPARETLARTLLESWDFEANSRCRACGIYRRWLQRVYDELELDEASLYRILNAHSRDRASVPDLPMRLKETLVSTLDDLKVSFSNPVFPRWDEIHWNQFKHLSDQKEFGVRRPLSTEGDLHSVNPGAAVWNGHALEHTVGASHRLIVEMSSPPKVFAMLAGSNEDESERDLANPEKPWSKWAHCQYDRRVYPVDWRQVEPIESTL